MHRRSDVGPLTDPDRVAAVRARAPVQAPAEPPERVGRPGPRSNTPSDIQRRIGTTPNCWRCRHPELRKIVATGRSLLLLNHRQYGARRGLLVSGDADHREVNRDHPTGSGGGTGLPTHSAAAADDAAPVVYLTMPPQATPKSLSIEILKFLGAPYLTRDSQIELTRQACHLLADLRNELILVDEIHNLNHHTRAGADASDHLKYLAENVAATFVYAGIDTARTGLFNDVRGRQLAGRFVPIHTQPVRATPPPRTGTNGNNWSTGSTACCACTTRNPGRLTRLATYLYGKTAGSISSLSMMIRSAAITAILDGTERITKAGLDAVPLDHAAATAGVTIRKGRVTRTMAATGAT